MTKKHILMILVTAVIGGVWLYVNRDWFANDRIQIHTRMVPAELGMRLAPSSAPAGNAVPIMFEWDRKLRLTSLKVVPVAAIQTNKYAHEIWHLVSDSNSVPTRGFIYGMQVPGMRPASKGLDPEPLVPGEKYRLFLQAGPIKAEHDFVAGAPPS
jgi:hypothetical protein